MAFVQINFAFLKLQELVTDCKGLQQTLNFQRSFIPALSKGNEHLSTGHDPSQLVYSGKDRLTVYSLAIDRILAPNLEEMEPMSMTFKCAMWSPKDLSRSGCLIATLSRDCQLHLYSCNQKSWMQAANISAQWLTHLQSLWSLPESSKYSEKVRQHVERTNLLASNAITWSHLLEIQNERIALLLTGQRSGDVVIWKVAGSQAKYAAHFHVSPGRISSLFWCRDTKHSGYLLVGFSSGEAHLLHVDCSKPDAVEIKSVTVVWKHQDRLQVHGMDCYIEDETLVCVVAKGNIVVACEVQLTSGCTSQKAEAFHRCPGLAITDIMRIEPGVYYVSQYDGPVRSVTLSRSDGKLEITSDVVTFDTERSKMACLGIASSRNHAILALAECIATNHDHLVLREPSRVIFFTSKNPSDLIETLHINESQSLQNYTDCLEVLRVLSLMPESQPLTIECEEFTSQNAYQLRLTRWFVGVSSVCTEEIEQQEILVAKGKEVEVWLFQRHALDILKLYSCKEKWDEREGRSIALMCLWLSQNGQDLDFTETKLLQQMSEKVADLAKEPAKCIICGDNLKQDSYKKASCPEGHNWPICTLTMEVCTNISYRECIGCKAVAAQQPAIPGMERCIFCEGRLISVVGLVPA